MGILAVTKGEWPNYKVLTQVGNVSLVQDEPLIQGGLNQGPSPFDAVMMGLASCTLITLRMYLEHKLARNIPGLDADSNQGMASLPDLEVSIAFDTDARAVKIESVRRVITVRLHDPDQDIDPGRLLIIANKCPVHNMLSPSMTIETTIELN
jgi:putative redox protein